MNPGSMKEHPIIFNSPMVQAILAGRKTQTRRKLNYQPFEQGGEWHIGTGLRKFTSNWMLEVTIEKATGNRFKRKIEIPLMEWLLRFAPYKVGDKLWVRETCLINHARDIVVRAQHAEYENLKRDDLYKVVPSIHMPRWASRLTLEITSVRVERLQAISEADAKAEGAAFTCSLCGNDLDTDDGAEVHAACDDREDKNASHREGFERLWTSLYGEESWEANPFVWAVEFRLVKPEGSK